MEQLKRESVSDQIFEQIKEQIVQGKWKPGMKIPSENKLTKMLGVSRISLREALQKLITLGILETKQGEGTFVKKVTGDTYMNSLLPFFMLDKPETINILEYRKIVECGVVSLAVEKATKEDILMLEQNVKKMEKNINNTEMHVEADVNFHIALAEITRNSVIIKVSYLTMEAMRKSMEDLYSPLDIKEFGLKYHKEIVNAIKERDKIKAQELMEEHIMKKIETLKKKSI